MSFILALLLLAAQEPASPAAAQPAAAHCTPPSAAPSRRIARLLASANGAAAASAYRVRNVGEEYQVLAALGLCPYRQSLVTSGRKPYDVLHAIDPRTGAQRELWFDIGSFFGRW